MISQQETVTLQCILCDLGWQNTQDDLSTEMQTETIENPIICSVYLITSSISVIEISSFSQSVCFRPSQIHIIHGIQVSLWTLYGHYIILSATTMTPFLGHLKTAKQNIDSGTQTTDYILLDFINKWK